jgi:hypothetical protein
MELISNPRAEVRKKVNMPEILAVKGPVLSGMSGPVRAKNSYPGQRKAGTSAGLRESVRDVRCNLKSYTYAGVHAGSESFCFISWELKIHRTSRTGLVKGSVLFGFSLSWQGCYTPDKPGHPGQEVC